MKQKAKAWSEEEVKFLKENFGKMTYNEIAVSLGRRYHGVQHKARTLGLRNFRSVKWTDEEKQFLIDNYPDKLGHYCAEKLGRSFHATHKMVEKLGLKPNWKYHYLSVEGYKVLCHDRENKILEHRYVMEHHLGRKLDSSEIVHHIDGNKLNNNINNLMITNRSDHINMHRKDLKQ